MNRMNALLIALLIGFAALAGTFAVTRTTQLGAAAQKQNAALIAQRQHRVAAGEAALRKALTRSPAPAAAMATRAGSTSQATAAPQPAAAPAAASAQRVVYVRPAPIVIHKHRAGGESDSRDAVASGAGGGFDD